MPILKGMGVYLQNLLENLGRIDSENEYFLYYDSRLNNTLRKVSAENLKFKGIAVQGEKFHLWEQWKLPQALKQDKIDIFHSPANTTMAASPCPVVVTVHDTHLQEIPRGTFFDRIYYGKVQPWNIRRAKRIITPSEYSKKNIVTFMKVPCENIAVIPLGINKNFMVPLDNNLVDTIKAKLDITGPYILNAGGESPWKNVSRLIQAFAVLVEKYRIKEKLLITGIRTKAILDKHLCEIENLGLKGKVHVLGYIPDDDLMGLYTGAELFVYPSLMEGFGFPPLEAMACGVPVVASNAASIPEVSGEGALYCDGKDSEDIAEKIYMVLSNKELRQDLISKGTNWVKRYRWERTAEETLEIYKRIV